MEEKIFKEVHENSILFKMANSLPILTFLIICIFALIEPPDIFKSIIGIWAILVIAFSVTYKIIYFIKYSKIIKKYNKKKAELYLEAIKSIYKNEIHKITNKRMFRSFLLEKIAQCEVEIDILDAKVPEDTSDKINNLQERQKLLATETLLLNTTKKIKYIDFSQFQT